MPVCIAELPRMEMKSDAILRICVVYRESGLPHPGPLQRRGGRGNVILGFGIENLEFGIWNLEFVTWDLEFVLCICHLRYLRRIASKWPPADCPALRPIGAIIFCLA